jgi:uncharacterized protein YecT (DUF1311 family)
MDTQPEQPSALSAVITRNGVMGWLRLNLGITVMIFSIASGIAGALISGTRRVAAADYQFADLVRVNTEQQKQIEQFHTDMVDVDRRLNTASSYTNDLRRSRDAEMAALQQRVAVLEAQLRFLADRTPTPTIGVRR